MQKLKAKEPEGEEEREEPHVTTNHPKRQKLRNVENKINTNVVRKIDIDYFGIYIENDGLDISR